MEPKLITKNHMAELNIISDLNTLLSLHGDAEIVYLTAEFAPFSNQHKPDIIFSCDDKILFIEYKIVNKISSEEHFINELKEHKIFVAESIESSFSYVYSTNAVLNPHLIEKLNSSGIIIFHSVNDAVTLYNEILNLTKHVIR